MNATKTDALSVIARSSEIAMTALGALKKSVSDLLDHDMDIIHDVSKDDQLMISTRQKNFLSTLIRKNIMDPQERENKMAEMESYSLADANLAIKALLGEN